MKAEYYKEHTEQGKAKYARCISNDQREEADKRIKKIMCPSDTLKEGEV